MSDELLSGGWMPIETAPKVNGEHILLSDGDWRGMGWWDGDMKLFMGDNLGWDGGSDAANATLWQPLPPLPTKEG